MSTWPIEQLAVEQAFLRRYLSYKAQGLDNANGFFWVREHKMDEC